MSVLQALNGTVGRLGFLEVKLLTVSAFVGGLLVAKLFPDVLTGHLWWYAAAAVAFALHPMRRLLRG